MMAVAGEAAKPETDRAACFFDELRAKTEDPPGVTRPSFGPGESIAHAMAADWARSLGLEITHDYAGNQYMTLPGSDRNAPAVIVGSHMDSVPHGGNFDGAAGVIAGLTAIDSLSRSGKRSSCDVTIMAIRAEEACWFSTHYAGSRMAFGLLPPEEYRTRKRSDSGRSLAAHIGEAGFDPEALQAGKSWLDPRRIRCFVEPHIEQGPSLVAAGIPVGIVTAIRGNLRYKNCRVEGEYGHAGVLRREQRHDAVFAAAEFARLLERRWIELEKNGTDLVCTMGELWTDPAHHAMTKISGEVRFTMDIRSESNDVLLDTDAHLREQAARIAAERGVAIELGEFSNAKPAAMDPALRKLLREQAGSLGIPYLELASGAGHDCATFAGMGVPSAMIFIRNDHGSHNPDEHMELADFEAATRLLAAFLARLT